MPWLRISQFDTKGGSVGDVPPQALPPGAFSSAVNTQFQDGALEKSPGMQQMLGAPPVAPYFLLSAQTNAKQPLNFMAGLAEIYEVGVGYTNVSRAVGGAYGATVQNSWTGGVLHGIPFLNNGVDHPQQWNPTASLFKNLDNWPSGHTAQALRAFKNYLIAINVQKSGSDFFPHNVLWSHPADPGTVPSTWAIADPTKDAGEAPLSETPGHLVDGLTMGDQFALYKEDATYIMQFVGAPNIFKFKVVLRESGVLSRNCIADVLGRHVVLTTDDVIMFDGMQAKSLMTRRWRRDLFNNLNVSEQQKAFMVALPGRQEVWCCIPTKAGLPPDLAYVWNWKNDTWTKRDIPFAQSLVWAFPPDQGDTTWDGDSGTWDSDAEAWSAYASLGKSILLAAPQVPAIYTYGVGNTLGGTAILASATHESSDFATEESPDVSDLVKHISKIRPRILAEPNTVLNFEIGTQMHINDSIDWGTAQAFTVGTTTELCTGRNGRYISWRVSSNTDCTWRLEALDFLFSVGGRF